MFFLKIWNSGSGGGGGGGWEVKITQQSFHNFVFILFTKVFFYNFIYSKIRDSKISIGFHLSYLNDLTRSSREDCILVASNKTGHELIIVCRNKRLPLHNFCSTRFRDSLYTSILRKFAFHKLLNVVLLKGFTSVL